MFDAGAVYGRIILDTSNYTEGLKKVQSGNQNLTASFLKANVLYDLAKKGLQALINVGSQAIKSYIEQEKAIAQMNAVLKSTNYAAGMSSKELMNLATALQKTTTYADETIMQAQNLLLTFTKIGKDVFPDATKTVLDMSTALGQDLKSSSIQLGKALQDPITGITALKRVGVNFTDSQKEMIETLVKSGKTLEAQKLILKELQTEFGGSAEAVRNTFGGALQALNNTQGELLEYAGKLIAIYGKDLVEDLNKAANGILDFINSAKGIEVISNIAGGIGGSVSVIGTIFKEFYNTANKYVIEIVEKILKKFEKLLGGVDKQQAIFFVLAGAVKIVGFGFGLLANIIGTVIDFNFNLIDVIKESVLVLKDFFAAMSNPFDPKGWENVRIQAVKTWESMKTLNAELTIDMEKNVVDFWSGLTNLPKDIESFQKELIESFQTGFSGAKEKAIKELTEIEEEVVKGNNNNITNTNESLIEIQKKYEDAGNNRLSYITEMYANEQEVLEEALEQSLITQEEYQTLQNESFTSYFSQAIEAIQSYYDTVSNITNTVLSSVQDIISQYYTNQSAIIRNEYTKRQTELDKKLQAGIISQEEYNKKTKKLKQQEAKDQYKIEKEQFYANMAFAILNVWLAAGQAVMGFWSAFASMGIAGIVLAGVMCHGKGTIIRMFDGSVKKVEDIKENDYVMGDDNTARFVSQLFRGQYHLYKIDYDDYEWTATGNHILSLYNPGKKDYIEITLKEYIDNSKYDDYCFYRKINNKIEIKKTKITYIGFKDFYGFEIDKNKLYQLGDGTITHNTGVVVALAIAQTALIASQQPPAPPAFATGGIIHGAKGVDNIDIKATDGELILAEAQQSVIADKLTYNNNAAQSDMRPLLIQLLLEGKLISEYLYNQQKLEAISR